jgi:hypothetical protein
VGQGLHTRPRCDRLADQIAGSMHTC